MRKIAIAWAALAGMAVGGTLMAQSPPAAGIKRTVLQKVEVPGGAHEVVFGMAEFPPGTAVGLHTHPGPVLAYVVDGEFTLLVEGQPEKVLKAGESFQVPGGTIHNERGGGTTAKVMAVYVLPKGQPVATPVK